MRISRLIAKILLNEAQTKSDTVNLGIIKSDMNFYLITFKIKISQFYD